jgi:2,4-dienoyl-CoA reductase (NADPH2)
VHVPGGFVDFAKTIKAAVTVPVIGVGRIEPELAEKAIASGDYDFVAMGRKLLADPDLPKKLIAGDSAAIRPCIYCYVCVSKIFVNETMSCAANPGAGREASLDFISPAAQPKKILVVGGGPGGMEAARVLALRGHTVSLWEKDRHLGGTARIAALAYEPNGRLIDYLQESITRLPVQVTLAKTASLASIQALAPDAVIVATGARRQAPAIAGKELPHVFDGEELRGVLFGGDKAAAAKLGFIKSGLIASARLLGITSRIDWLRKLSYLYMPFGKHITIIGGGLVGLEVAELLAERGRRVTVLEPSRDLGAELSLVRRWRVLHELASHQVELVRNVEIDRIEPQSVYYSVDGEGRSVTANQVIIAMGAQPDASFCQQLNALGIDAHAIGDCQQVSYIEGAMLSARQVAQTL